MDVPVVTHGQAQHTDRIVDLPAVCKRQEPLIATAKKTGEFTQIQFLDRVDDVPVSMQRSAPMIQKVPKTVKFPQVQFIDRVVNVPVIAQRQVPVQRFQKSVQMPKVQFLDSRRHASRHTTPGAGDLGELSRYRRSSSVTRS